MRYITWYGLLAVGVAGVLLPSIAGRAQAPQAQAPQAKVRELATIEGHVCEYVRLPSRARSNLHSDTSASLLDNVDNSTFTYDVATKRRTLLGTNMLRLPCRRKAIDLPSADPRRMARKISCGRCRSIQRPASRPARRSA